MIIQRWRQLGLESRLRALYEKYEMALVPGLLLLGFVVDLATFRTLRTETTFVLLGVHAAVAGLAIAYASIYDGRPNPPGSRILSYLRFAAPILVQFTFGALLSSSLIFYWYSGALFASWPLLALVVLLMASNEAFRHYYLRPAVQLGVYAFVLLSYFSLLFPFVFRSLSPAVFVLSGLASTLVVILLALAVGKWSPEVRRVRGQVVALALAVLGGMNALYFFNVIPPIPLFVREAGAYQDLQVRDGQYALSGAPATLIERLWSGQTISNDADGRVYAYAAIFAPTELSATIVHVWQRYDDAGRRWVTSDRISYAIFGGRQDGYRGYTYKHRLAPGKWRVVVETERGQVLGRIPFRVAE